MSARGSPATAKLGAKLRRYHRRLVNLGPEAVIEGWRQIEEHSFIAHRAQLLIGDPVAVLDRVRSGIDRLLNDRELDAVLIHEMTHARRRDNLVCLIHEIALCGLWFHPLVWLTGSRLAMFRELSCDDAVIAGARGADLVSALAKLADPGESQLLRAGAATLFRHRLVRLQTSQPHRGRAATDLALIMIYVAVLLACTVETIAHTPGCFKVLM
jgi:hypothetical protein